MKKKKIIYIYIYRLEEYGYVLTEEGEWIQLEGYDEQVPYYVQGKDIFSNLYFLITV